MVPGRPGRLFAAACLLALGASAAAFGHSSTVSAADEGSAPPAAVELPSRDQFLARSNLGDVQLSPDGRTVAFVDRSGSEQSLWRLDTASGVARRLGSSDARRLHWSSDGNWLFIESARQLTAIDVRTPGDPVVVTQLGGAGGTSVLTVDPGSPDGIIVIENDAASPQTQAKQRLVRLNSAGERIVLHEDHRQVLDLAFDAAGRLAYLRYPAGDHHSVERLDADGRLRPILRCVRLEQCHLLVGSPDGRLLMQSDAGGDLQRLVSVGQDGAVATLRQDRRRQADLDSVTMDPATRQPLILSYRSTGARNIGLTPAAGRNLRAIERQIGHANYTIVPASGPGARWLVTERGERLQFPRRHLFDPATRRLVEILQDRTGTRIPENSLGRQRPIAFRASDGRLVHGFITLPPGPATSRPPLVVNVHGGPWSHILPGYNPLSQFLASRGYAVFEPNFRSSTGYGRRYLFSSGGDFGNGRVQQDIVEGTRHILAQGLADPRRVAIVGISFGGYSALLGATFQPELYRTAIAVSPPTDFASLIDPAPGTPDPLQDGIPLSVRLRFHSLDGPAVAARLSAQSPATNAAVLRRPVYILAGARDQLVAVEDIRRYAERLRTLRRDVHLVVDPQGGHGPTTPSGQQALLYIVEQALHAEMGGPAPMAASPALAEFIRSNSVAGN